MKVKGIIDEDFVNYKQPNMLVLCHSCSFKCDKESGEQVCQNSTLANTPDIEISIDSLVKRYINNPITKAVVFGGLEPFDDIENVIDFISKLRYNHNNNDYIIIYTGYTEDEIKENYQKAFNILQMTNNIIIKFGRFIPNCDSRFDYTLGVKLASDNQYAKYINMGGYIMI